MPRSLKPNDIPQFIADEAGQVYTAVLAGHFGIFSAGATAVDLLEEQGPIPTWANSMREFTRDTWAAACAALSAGTSAQLVVLVDDVQFVRPALSDRRASERLAASLVEHYFEITPQLPKWHLNRLIAHGLAPTVVLQESDERWLFSERALRRSAVERLRHAATTQSTDAVALSMSADGGQVNVRLPDTGEYCIVHSGQAACAGGYLELLCQLHNRGVRKLIALVPQRCAAQVGVGSHIARSLGLVPGLAVVNVGVPDSDTGARLTIDRG